MSQNDIEFIKEKFTIINTEKEYKIVNATNEDIFDDVIDAHYELSGYFKGDTLFKIIEKIYSPTWVVFREFYIWHNELIFLYKKNQAYHYDGETDEIDYEVLELVNELRLYYKNGDLIKTIPIEDQTKAESEQNEIFESYKKYIDILNDKNNMP